MYNLNVYVFLFYDSLVFRIWEHTQKIANSTTVLYASYTCSVN